MRIAEAKPISWYLQKLGIKWKIHIVLFCFLEDYRYKKDELFKRLKVTTFAQLVRIDPCLASPSYLLSVFSINFISILSLSKAFSLIMWPGYLIPPQQFLSAPRFPSVKSNPLSEQSNALSCDLKFVVTLKFVPFVPFGFLSINLRGFSSFLQQGYIKWHSNLLSSSCVSSRQRPNSSLTMSLAAEGGEVVISRLSACPLKVINQNV